ncbi:hypothetical protein G4Q83_17185 [Xanthomonas theicola]|nr:hypothetical protein G4Q83_17185 [Xanthomonas theicola]
MDIDPALEANVQLAHRGEPGMGAIEHPALASQPVVARDARGDAAVLEMAAAAVDVIGRVGVPLAWPTPCTPGLASDVTGRQ